MTETVRTCANCDSPASYTFADPGAVPIDYCDRHLPSWLRSRAHTGGLPLSGTSPQEPEASPEPEPEVVVVYAPGSDEEADAKASEAKPKRARKAPAPKEE